ncbi:MAG: glutaminase [Bacteroidales bacterium]|jgi:glutaminase
MPKYKSIIANIYNQVKDMDLGGKVATYIPELAKVNPNYFGVHLSSVDGNECGIGDYQIPFSIQSISKIFILSYAYVLFGEKLWQRVGVEPSGTPFNSLIQLESDKGIPRNPFINAGALVVCDMLVSELKNPLPDLFNYMKKITQIDDIYYNKTVAESEKKAGYRNVALCNFIKSFGNIDNEPEEVLDFYFKICSIELSCQQMSKAFLYLTSDKFRVNNPEIQLNESQAKRIKALMQTCGFYDESGEFAFKVGLPGKSGVGGGIIAICPDRYSIATWSPLLNQKGNSQKGFLFLEQFTTQTAVSIF